ncbi:MAG: TraB/VirB10 family protein [Rhodanobacter sp.]
MKQMNAKQKRSLLFGGVVFAFVATLAIIARTHAVADQKAPVSAQNVLTNADSRAISVATLNTTVSDVQGKLTQLTTDKTQLQDQNKQLQDQVTAIAKTLEAMQRQQQTQAVSAQQTQAAPDSGYGGDQHMTLIDPSAVGGSLPSAPAKAGSSAQPGPADVKSGDKKASADTYLPPGSILTGVLLTGADAPTGRSAQATPVPVLTRIKLDAILPNRYTENLADCHLVGSAFGDLSSERAFIRADRLSCIRKDGGVIDIPLQAYAVGEDGKAGMRGKLVSKQGQILARSMLAGAAGGIAEAFKPQQVQYLSSGSSNDAYQSVPAGQTARIAAGGGISSAMTQLAQFYMNLAEQEFPVIEVSAGRQINFVVEKGVALQLANEEQH